MIRDHSSTGFLNMVLLQTPAMDKPMAARDFYLLSVDGKKYSLSDVKGDRGTIVMFICNHCPYVQFLIKDLVEHSNNLMNNYGIGVVAIMPNDTEAFSEDNFDNMKMFAHDNEFKFPYLLDETQKVAENYKAVCTPDFFCFNADLQLSYRGRFWDLKYGEQKKKDTSYDLIDAVIEISEKGSFSGEQKPSMGCSIKWK